MVHAIVEGEPGIFPDPIARIMRGIGGLFRKGDEPRPAPPPPEGEGQDTDGPDDADRPAGEPGR